VSYWSVASAAWRRTRHWCPGEAPTFTTVVGPKVAVGLRLPPRRHLAPHHEGRTSSCSAPRCARPCNGCRRRSNHYWLVTELASVVPKPAALAFGSVVLAKRTDRRTPGKHSFRAAMAAMPACPSTPMACARKLAGVTHIDQFGEEGLTMPVSRCWATLVPKLAFRTNKAPAKRTRRGEKIDRHGGVSSIFALRPHETLLGTTRQQTHLPIASQRQAPSVIVHKRAPRYAVWRYRRPSYH
jgi:hypothetical protein